MRRLNLRVCVKTRKFRSHLCGGSSGETNSESWRGYNDECDEPFFDNTLVIAQQRQSSEYWDKEEEKKKRSVNITSSCQTVFLGGEDEKT